MTDGGTDGRATYVDDRNTFVTRKNCHAVNTELPISVDDRATSIRHYYISLASLLQCADGRAFVASDGIGSD
jgi:hypothetical protein